MGLYWLGQQYSSQMFYALTYGFDEDDDNLYLFGRMHGLPVRPVAK
jgi:hypothetical protein